VSFGHKFINSFLSMWKPKTLALGNGHLRHRIALTNGINHILATGYFAKDCVLSIQMGLGGMGDKELAAIGIWPGVSHRKRSRIVLDGVAPKFIFKPVAGATSARACRVATLDHKVADDSVKNNAVVKALSGQEYKVVNGFGRVLGVEI
jgi:hypothetical protein